VTSGTTHNASTCPISRWTWLINSFAHLVSKVSAPLQCGVKYMQSRIDAWSKKGGKKDKLWENVKGAEKREGVVIRAEEDQDIKMEVDTEGQKTTAPPKKSNKEREVERLNAQLNAVVLEREEIKKEMEVILWRERLTELASERSEKLDTCGWDQRLCIGDEEWADFGAGVLESYEEMEEGDDSMQVDGPADGEGEWWCAGKKKCDRHAG
jgi:COMPASS component SPP1